MRPLTEDETRTVFVKLSEYIGRSVEKLIDRSDERHTFRLFDNGRVHYVSESVERAATTMNREGILSAGVCLGKMTKGGNFQLRITALDYLAEHAEHKVWIKQSAEMSFLYGNNVTKGGLARITENVKQHSGVVVFSMADVPLGFGVAAQSTERCADLDPTRNVVLHQGDIGEYLRTAEDEMF